MSASRLGAVRPHDFEDDILAIGGIPAVPTILELVCRTTGMGFAAVARVTEDRWVACEVHDKIGFGLEPGGELKVETTICSEIRRDGIEVIIDQVSADETYSRHPTPALYGFESYISVPIRLPNGTFFGTLCAIDPKPARVNTPEIVGVFRMFAELIGFHLDAHRRVAVSTVERDRAWRLSQDCWWSDGPTAPSRRSTPPGPRCSAGRSGSSSASTSWMCATRPSGAPCAPSCRTS
jgi:hypothetical protein